MEQKTEWKQNSEQKPEQKQKSEHRTGLEQAYIIQDNKKLKMGYTTGSCAAAAAKAATAMLLGGEPVEEVSLMTPKGILLHLLIEDTRIQKDEDGNVVCVSCAVRKDGGDDPDATHGLLVFAEVQRNSLAEKTVRSKTENSVQPKVENSIHPKAENSIQTNVENSCEKIRIDGGSGVGRVTKPGLAEPVGAAAINPVPRKMITKEVAEQCDFWNYSGGIDVKISIPGGEEVAQKTFNPRLGIEGGLSVLGTSGIVVPMSEDALIASIRLEMRMLVEAGAKVLLITPGNYGEAFAGKMGELDRSAEMKCSNYVGETIDYAVNLGVEGILFISHIGKFIKVAGGIMNTHSKNADSRAELMTSAYIRAGGNLQTAKKLLQTITTEEALDVLQQDDPDHYSDTMQEICSKVEFYLKNRCKGSIRMGAVLFSQVHGKLGETSEVPALIRLLNQQGAQLPIS